jgi:hypothetical protein
MSRRLSPIANVAEMVPSAKLPISPLVGEMSGRTEGGAKDRGLSLRPLSLAQTFPNSGSWLQIESI